MLSSPVPGIFPSHLRERVAGTEIVLRPHVNPYLLHADGLGFRLSLEALYVCSIKDQLAIPVRGGASFLALGPGCIACGVIDHKLDHQQAD